MKPAWDKLMKAFKEHATTLVADVDCTAGGKPLCDELGVEGFPTIKHGDPTDLQAYEGGWDFKALKNFADSLGPACSPKNIDLCDDEKKAKIVEFAALGADKRAELITEQEGELATLESDFKTFVEGLQKSYDEANSKKDAAIADVKNSGLGLLKSVHAYETKAKSEL